MLTRFYTAYAPSNIALIKYMGKIDSSLNLPANGSLSLTLNHLRTIVEIEGNLKALKLGGANESSVTYLPELPRVYEGGLPKSLPLSLPPLSESGVKRALDQVTRVQNAAQDLFPKYGLHLERGYSLKIRTANTFPTASGIASSASSFAAITLATALSCSRDPKRFEQAWKNEIELRRALSDLSRQGSGSSCRSLEGPWVKWEGSSVNAVDARMPRMTDLVLLISSASKEVSSSHAHSQVQTSPLWKGRVDRANQRLKDLERALSEGNFSRISDIAWAELWEMHSLFHTCETPFTYWEPGTLKVLKYFASYFAKTARSQEINPLSIPIVTMDAGANVHLLIPSEKAGEWKARISEAFPTLKVLEDQESTGAEFLEGLND